MPPPAPPRRPKRAGRPVWCETSCAVAQDLVALRSSSTSSLFRPSASLSSRDADPPGLECFTLSFSMARHPLAPQLLVEGLRARRQLRDQLILVLAPDLARLETPRCAGCPGCAVPLLRLSPPPCTMRRLGASGCPWPPPTPPVVRLGPRQGQGHLAVGDHSRQAQLDGFHVRGRGVPFGLQHLPLEVAQARAPVHLTAPHFLWWLLLLGCGGAYSPRGCCTCCTAPYPPLP